MPQANVDPLRLLHQMQHAGRLSAPGLPEQVQAAPLWSGLGFRVDNLQLVAPLDQVTEVLTATSITVVPGTKRWVKGIANVRGNLYTIIDLPEYFAKRPVEINDKARFLVLNRPGLHAALVVNEVFGLRHFDEATEKQDISSLSDAVFEHVGGAFLRDNVLWGIFDFHSLVESPAFIHVAA